MWAMSGDAAAIAPQAEIVANFQADGAQTGRILALHDAPSTAIAELFVDFVLVVVVQRVERIDFADHFAADGVAWAEPFARQPVRSDLAPHVKICGTDAATAAPRKVVHGPDG